MPSYDDLINDSSQKLSELKELVDSLLGGNMATQEEIKNAIIQALEEGASRFLSGQGGNVLGGVSIDKDGNITVTPPGATPDDPTTSADEEARSGGAIAVRIGLTNILTELNAWFGSDTSADIPAAEAIFRMDGKYEIANPTALNTAITDYWTFLGGGGAKLTSWGTNFDQWLYCEGHDAGDIVAYIIDNINGNYHSALINLIKSFDKNQIYKWYNAGEQVPSTAYIQYSCVPVEKENFQLDMSQDISQVQYTTNAVYKAGHRLRLKVSGTYTDPVSPDYVKDFFYQHRLSTGQKTFTPPQFQKSGISAFTSAQVPFNPNHEYDVTVDIASTGGNGAIIIGRDRTAGQSFSNTTVGTLSGSVEDLGEYI